MIYHIGKYGVQFVLGNIAKPDKIAVAVHRVPIPHPAEISHPASPLREKCHRDFLGKGDHNVIRINGLATGLQHQMVVLHPNIGKIKPQWIKPRTLVCADVGSTAGRWHIVISSGWNQCKCDGDGVICIDIVEGVLPAR